MSIMMMMKMMMPRQEQQQQCCFRMRSVAYLLIFMGFAVLGRLTFTNTSLMGDGITRFVSISSSSTTTRSHNNDSDDKAEELIIIKEEEEESKNYYGEVFRDDQAEAHNNNSQGLLAAAAAEKPNHSDYDIVNHNSGTTFMNRMLEDSWWQLHICKSFGSGNGGNKLLRNSKRFLYEMEFDELDLFQHSGYGTGNFVAAFYLTRLIAQIASASTEVEVDVNIEGTNTEVAKKHTILPWLTGYFGNTKQIYRKKLERFQNILNTKKQMPTLGEVCLWKQDNNKPITHPNPYLKFMLPEIQMDARRMAIATVGIPSKDHPSYAWAKKHLLPSLNTTTTTTSSLSSYNNYAQMPAMEPLYPNIQLDDVVIHFRCGDLMDVWDDHGYMFQKFDIPAANIPINYTKRIGILTNPFVSSKVTRGTSLEYRDDKSWIGQKCKVVVEGFVQYLQQQHPAATITIHNDPNEPISVAWSRMIMAKDAAIMSTMSSFAYWPIASTFGYGYLKARPNTGFHTWILDNEPFPINKYNSKLHSETLSGDGILGCKLQQIWFHANGGNFTTTTRQQADDDDLVLQWFRQETNQSVVELPKCNS